MHEDRQRQSDEAFADEKLYRDQRAVYRNSTGPDARDDSVARLGTTAT